MPEFSVNSPLSPDEAVSAALARVDRLIECGACSTCAIRVACHELGISHDQLVYFFVERESRQRAAIGD